MISPSPMVQPTEAHCGAHASGGEDTGPRTHISQCRSPWSLAGTFSAISAPRFESQISSVSQNRSRDPARQPPGGALAPPSGAIPRQPQDNVARSPMSQADDNQQSHTPEKAAGNWLTPLARQRRFPQTPYSWAFARMPQST